jgi:hypothetical protein
MEALSRFITVRADEWDHQDPDVIDAYLELCSGGEKILDEIVRYIIVHIQDRDLLTSKTFSDETHTNVHRRSQ